MPYELMLGDTLEKMKEIPSGTTGVACMNTGRRFIGIERDEKYFAICEDRILKAYMDKYEI